MPRKRTLEERIAAKYGEKTLSALTEFCKNTPGCSLEDVAPVDLLPKSLPGLPVDANGPISPEVIREFCQKETSGLRSDVQRLRGKRFKNRSDYKPSIEEKHRIADRRIAWGLTAKPTRPLVLFIFRYRVLSADEIKTISWFTHEWQSATAAFRKTTQGQRVALLNIERRPVNFARVGWPEVPHRLVKVKKYVPDKQFRLRYAILREFVQQNARRLARDRLYLQDELEQRAWMKLAVDESDNIEFLKAQILIAMESGLRAERRFRRRLRNATLL